MIEQFVNEMFERIGHTWTISGEPRTPSEENIRGVLDNAARELYDRDVDTQLQTGGLIIEKAPRGYDVYVYVGNYQ